MTDAVKAYQRKKQAEFWCEIAFTAVSVASGDVGSIISMKSGGDKDMLNAIKICKVVEMTAKLGSAILDCESRFPGFGGVVAMPSPFENTTDSTDAYTADSANTFKQLATQTNEVLGKVTPAQFVAFSNEVTVNMQPYLSYDDGGVIAAATKLLMDVKTGMSYKRDHYDAMIAYAAAAGRTAVATAQIVALKQVVSNIENLQDDIEDAQEEQHLVGTIAALQMLLGALNSADFLAQLCNAHMYANGGLIDSHIQHVCGVEGGFAPTPELLHDILDSKATLGDIVKSVGNALGSFEEAPELFYRPMPTGVSSRIASFTFSSEQGSDIQFSELGLGDFLDGKEMTFSLYKGSPLLELFTTDNFNNPILVGYTTLLDGVEIKDPGYNKYLDIRLGFAKSFEVYNGPNPKQFLKPKSTEWPVSSIRPMHDSYCFFPAVQSPETGKLFCPQASLSKSESPQTSKDDLFAFDSIYTTYTLTLRNPEIIADMTDDEKENVRLSLFFYYYNTVGEASSEAEAVRNLATEKHHGKLAGRPMSLEQVEEDGVTYMRPIPVNT